MAQAQSETHQKPDTLDETTLHDAGELEVLDASGKAIPFRQLYNTEGRQVIVFIRHFFCGHCEDYVRELTKHFPPKDLERIKPTTALTIIGCGEPSAIAGYKQRTGTSFSIYCDPTRKLYLQLGMTSSLSMGDHKPNYVQSSILSGTIKSMSNMIAAGSGAFKGGDYSQNGGECVFVDGQLEWIHRMQHTRDHAELAELGKVLGFEIKN